MSVVTDVDILIILNLLYAPGSGMNRCMIYGLSQGSTNMNRMEQKMQGNLSLRLID